MPPTLADCCDWCYGPLTQADLSSRIGEILGEVEAAACHGCVDARRFLKPPDSLDPDDVRHAGNQAWMFAVATALEGGDAELPAAIELLRQVAGYA